MIGQHLWRSDNQILLMIVMKEFRKLNVNTDMMIKKMWNVWNKIQRLWVLPWILNVIDDLIVCKCLCCNRNYKKKVWWKLKKWFANIYIFSNHDIPSNIYWLVQYTGSTKHELICKVTRNIPSCQVKSKL